MSADYRAMLNQRLTPKPTGGLDVLSDLQHFALINYALPKARLERYIPSQYFEIPEFNIGGKPMALMSAVPFVDVDFHFLHLSPFLKFHFGQTNYRVYVIDKRTCEHAVWFFGTTLGSIVVAIPKFVWRIPWHYARYDVDCQYDQSQQRYTHYYYHVKSSWANARIELEDTGRSLEIVEGFDSLDAVKFIITHPLAGYFYRSDRRLGTYSVWHDEINCTMGKPRDLYFGLYERLGLLSREEMQQPHSIFISPLTKFTVFLPPRKYLL
ncbi:MAG: DUF2071 domain-containing protein [Herpetosiphon sp.]|nr:DUF2071 domain-containing protein [Herpetosiphon sp.]